MTENKTGLEKLFAKLEFMMSGPIGGPSGEHLFSRAYLCAIEDILQITQSLIVDEQLNLRAECVHQGIDEMTTEKPPAPAGLIEELGKYATHLHQHDVEESQQLIADTIKKITAHYWPQEE